MSDSSQNSKIPEQVIDLLVNDIFKKNGINAGSVKKNLSEEQKQAIKDLVQDLTKQVNTFVNPQKNSPHKDNE